MNSSVIKYRGYKWDVTPGDEGQGFVITQRGGAGLKYPAPTLEAAESLMQKYKGSLRSRSKSKNFKRSRPMLDYKKIESLLQSKGLPVERIERYTHEDYGCVITYIESYRMVKLPNGKEAQEPSTVKQITLDPVEMNSCRKVDESAAVAV